ncbi:MAG: right-handed parallel beta-helix repeat-containing protein, partial [Akkermansiaceae bacterium]|nr:right-handed parallel beta-helix repeat-containing protein [Akkermansiaceae bacterium]
MKIRSFLTLFCLMISASGAEYYVSTTGSNTNPGTLALPWRTIQKGADTVVAGDVVNIRAGTYAERVSITDKDGTLALPIVFQAFAGDSGAVIIDQTGITPPNGVTALFSIQNSDHIILRKLELANYKTVGTDAQQRSQIPVGLYIAGDGNGIQILSCKVHDIWQSSATLNNFGANGFGIAVYSSAANAIDNLVIDDCEIYALRTGASESVVLNGNVTNFRVTNNRVHDCNNIGIDFIGFEGTNSNLALDQARNGVCSGNRVWKIDSKFNPAYGGNFTTGGGNETRAAPGLYVDGGKDIVMERNHVYDCNFAVSIGSENTGRTVTGVIVRNNLFHHCHVGGIVMGGSDVTNGGAADCTVSHNTIYDNDTTGSGGGQVMIQNYVSNVTIRRNIIASTASFAQLVLKSNTTGSFAAGAIDWNLYRVNPGAFVEFIWEGTAYSNFNGWKGAASLAKDVNSQLITASLGLVNQSPASTSPATDFSLTENSPARNSGDSAALTF